VRSKHSRTKSFSVLSARKLEQERKLDEAGSGEAKEGMLARKPLNFEKRPLVSTVEFTY